MSAILRCAQCGEAIGRDEPFTTTWEGEAPNILLAARHKECAPVD